MKRRYCLTLLLSIGFIRADDVVFKSDVSLVRVDVQVLDRNNRAISGLQAKDFVLRDQGREQPIRNFLQEDMPIDVLFLFDVSASMRPHVQRIADAAHEALRVLTDKDRVAIMVFDRSTRVRMQFRSSQSQTERELENMLRQESFRGGTDITRGLLDAADYVKRQGRKEARKAIVILTDDQTEFERDDARVGRALENADAVLSALIAPDAMAGRYGGGGYPGGGGRQGGSTWPGGGGGGLGGPLGGIILGRRGGYGGGNRGGGGMGGPRTKSAGTSEIARDSGGDSMSVDDAAALETTLSRLRQRYALHFLVPPGARAGQERSIEVALADNARRRYPDADLRFRKTYLSPSDTGGSDGSSVAAATSGNSDPVLISPDSGSSRRRRAVSEPEGPRGATTGVADTSQSTSSTPDQQAPAAAAPVPATTQAAPNTTGNTDQPKPGWRKLKPGEQP